MVWANVPSGTPVGKAFPEPAALAGCRGQSELPGFVSSVQIWGKGIGFIQTHELGFPEKVSFYYENKS